MFLLVLMPCARDICRFAPVARMEEPSSVPKNQYRMATIATTNSPTMKMGCMLERLRTLAHFLQIAQRDQQGLFIHIEGLIGFHTHDGQID